MMDERDLDSCWKCKVPTDNSPYSICYDAEWKRNVWGGDTHVYIAYICNMCAKELGLDRLVDDALRCDS